MLIVQRADDLLVKCAETHGIASDRPGLCRECLVALLALASARVARSYVTKTVLHEKLAKARKARAARKAATKEKQKGTNADR